MSEQLYRLRSLDLSSIIDPAFCTGSLTLEEAEKAQAGLASRGFKAILEPTVEKIFLGEGVKYTALPPTQELEPGKTYLMKVPSGIRSEVVRLIEDRLAAKGVQVILTDEGMEFTVLEQGRSYLIRCEEHCISPSMIEHFCDGIRRLGIKAVIVGNGFRIEKDN